jgi:hypothetical protein
MIVFFQTTYHTDYALSAHMINIMVSLHHNFTLQANNPNTEKLFFVSSLSGGEVGGICPGVVVDGISKVVSQVL